ncbi:hypothetical protein KC340_g8 [Hortaea werneckii]|nr:hypothetical protein KC340_g8 [Hortaea werneckii]
MGCRHALADISHHHLDHPSLFGQIMKVSYCHNSTKQQRLVRVQMLRSHKASITIYPIEELDCCRCSESAEAAQTWLCNWGYFQSMCELKALQCRHLAMRKTLLVRQSAQRDYGTVLTYGNVGLIDANSYIKSASLVIFERIEDCMCYRSQASFPGCRTHFAFALEQVTHDLAVETVGTEAEQSPDPAPVLNPPVWHRRPKSPAPDSLTELIGEFVFGQEVNACNRNGVINPSAAPGVRISTNDFVRLQRWHDAIPCLLTPGCGLNLRVVHLFDYENHSAARNGLRGFESILRL